MLNWRGLILTTATVAAGWAADIDPAALLTRAQVKIRANARAIPRFMCHQEIERQSFVPSTGRSKICGTLEASGGVKRTLLSSDRARLDVMLGKDTELFSWPGAHSFDVDDPGNLLAGGFSGSGDFAGFVVAVFGGAQISFEYQGACGPFCARFAYDVPRAVSNYRAKTMYRDVTVAYHGTFDVDPGSADLLRMTVIPTDLAAALPGTCALRTEMIYTRATVNAGEFMIPVQTDKEYLAEDGSYFVNRSVYKGCREYTAESSLSFGDDTSKDLPAVAGTSAALPVAGSKIDLRLRTRIDSEQSAAGDSLEATLVKAVKDTSGGMIAAGTVVRGHLVQLEKIYFPRDQVRLAMRFDTIVLHGTAVPLRLSPNGAMDQRGRAVFEFSGSKLVLDQKFLSRWRVAE